MLSSACGNSNNTPRCLARRLGMVRCTPKERKDSNCQDMAEGWKTTLAALVKIVAFKEDRRESSLGFSRQLSDGGGTPPTLWSMTARMAFIGLASTRDSMGQLGQLHPSRGQVIRGRINLTLATAALQGLFEGANKSRASRAICTRTSVWTCSTHEEFHFADSFWF